MAKSFRGSANYASPCIYYYVRYLSSTYLHSFRLLLLLLLLVRLLVGLVRALPAAAAQVHRRHLSVSVAMVTARRLSQSF